MKTLIRFYFVKPCITLLLAVIYCDSVLANYHCDISYVGGGCYIGAIDWLESKKVRHGYGNMKSKDWSYDGHYWNDKPHGKGTLKFQSGQRYTGKWYDGEKQGQGTYWWPSGEKYEGEWKGDNEHGKGTLHYQSGGKFVGTFKNGSEWNGTFYSESGIITGEKTNGERVRLLPMQSSSSSSSFSATGSAKVWCTYSGGVAQVTSFTCNNWSGKSFQTKSSAQTEFRKLKPLDMSQSNSSVVSDPPAMRVGSWIGKFWKTIHIEKWGRNSQRAISKTLGIHSNDFVVQLGKYVALFLCLLFLCWEGKEGKNAFGWYFSVLGKYAVFSGRAQRKEFWYFWLMHAIVSVALGLAEERFDLTPDTDASVLFLIYGLVVLLPGFAVNARRLHDTGRSGWWQLVVVIPVVGPVVFVIFCAIDSHSGPNKYGLNPKTPSGHVPLSDGSGDQNADPTYLHRNKSPSATIIEQGDNRTDVEDPVDVIVSDSDDELYEQAWREIEEGKQDKALWARLYTGYGGDESRIKVEYINQRVLQKKVLLSEAEQIAEMRKREEEDRLNQVLAESRRQELENEARIKNRLKEETDRQRKIEKEEKRKQLEEKKLIIALDKEERLRLEKIQREEEIDRLRNIALDKQEHLRLEKAKKDRTDEEVSRLITEEVAKVEENRAELDLRREQIIVARQIEREQNREQKTKEERLRLEKMQREEEIDGLRNIALDKQEHLRLEEEKKEKADRLKKIEKETKHMQLEDVKRTNAIAEQEREASKPRQERAKLWEQSGSKNKQIKQYQIDETKSDEQVETELLSRLSAVDRFESWERTDVANNRTQLLAAVKRHDQVSMLRWIKSGVDPNIVLNNTDPAVQKVLENSPAIKQIFDVLKRFKDKGGNLVKQTPTTSREEE